MKKMLIGLLVLAGCSPPAPPASSAPKKPAAVKKEAVVLEGTAKNDKAGAILVTADKSVWIHSLAAWPADTLGKRLTLKGELHTLPPAPATLHPMGNAVQSVLGPQYFLHDHVRVDEK